MKLESENDGQASSHTDKRWAIQFVAVSLTGIQQLTRVPSKCVTIVKNSGCYVQAGIKRNQRVLLSLVAVITLLFGDDLAGRIWNQQDTHMPQRSVKNGSLPPDDEPLVLYDNAPQLFSGDETSRLGDSYRKIQHGEFKESKRIAELHARRTAHSEVSKVSLINFICHHDIVTGNYTRALTLSSQNVKQVLECQKVRSASTESEPIEAITKVVRKVVEKPPNLQPLDLQLEPSVRSWNTTRAALRTTVDTTTLPCQLPPLRSAVNITTFDRYACILQIYGHLDSAIALAEFALDLCEKNARSQPSDQALDNLSTVRRRLAFILAERGEIGDHYHAECLSLLNLEHTKEVWHTISTETSTFAYADSLVLHALIHWNQGDRIKAVSLVEQSVEILDRQRMQNPSQGVSYHLALALEALGDVNFGNASECCPVLANEARTAYERAYGLTSQFDGGSEASRSHDRLRLRLCYKHLEVVTKYDNDHEFERRLLDDCISHFQRLNALGGSSTMAHSQLADAIQRFTNRWGHSPRLKLGNL